MAELRCGHGWCGHSRKGCCAAVTLGWVHNQPELSHTGHLRTLSDHESTVLWDGAVAGVPTLGGKTELDALRSLSTTGFHGSRRKKLPDSGHLDSSSSYVSFNLATFWTPVSKSP